MMNLNSKFPKSLMPSLTTDIAPANSYTLSAGLVTKALMKKPLGSLHPNSDMLWNSSQIFTWHTLPNMALCQVFLDCDFSSETSEFTSAPTFQTPLNFPTVPHLAMHYLRILGRDH